MNPMLSDDDYVDFCPTSSEIKQMSLNYTCHENNIFHVLLDPRRNQYRCGCFENRIVPEGYETVLDNNTGKVNAVPCHEGTFQRHPYMSNTQCACNETKGHCNKTGQVVASNGSTTEDRTCRCDCRRGYKFSTKPLNECLCKSSSEDCTCIIEECETGYKWSPGSECVDEKLYSTINDTCNFIVRCHVARNTTKSAPVIDTNIFSERNTTLSAPVIDTSVSQKNTTLSAPDIDTSVSQKNKPVSVPGMNLDIPEIVSRWMGVSYVKAIFIICGAFVILDKIRIFCQQHRPFRKMLPPTNDEERDDPEEEDTFI